MVPSQGDDQVRRQIPPMVGQDRFRRRVMIKGLSVSDSARRHLQAQLNISNLTEVHRPGLISRSRLRLVEDMRMKRALKEKECRALMVNRLPHNSTSRRRSSSRSSSMLARLPQPITARATGSRKGETKKHKNQHLRRGRNNLAQ